MIQAKVKPSANGQFHWTVSAGNNRKIATGGETFIRRGGAANSLMRLAYALRDMTPQEFEAFEREVMTKRD